MGDHSRPVQLLVPSTFLCCDCVTPASPSSHGLAPRVSVSLLISQRHQFETVPGGPVVGTLHFHCRGFCVQSQVGELRSYMLHSAAKKKKQRERVPSTCQKLSPILTEGDSGIPTLSHPSPANPTHLSFGKEPSPPGPQSPRSSHEWPVSLWPGPPRPLLEVSHQPRRGPARSTSDGTVVYSS